MRSDRAARLLRVVLLTALPLGLVGALVLWTTVGLGPLAPLTGLAFESRRPASAALVFPAADSRDPIPADHDVDRRDLPTDQEHALRIAELETRRAALEAEVEALVEARRTAQQALDELLALRREELGILEELQLRQRALAEELDDLEVRRAELLRSSARPPPAPAPASAPPSVPVEPAPAPGAGPGLEPLVATEAPEPAPAAPGPTVLMAGPMATADPAHAVPAPGLLAEPGRNASPDDGTTAGSGASGDTAGPTSAADTSRRRVFIHYSTLQDGAEALARRIAEQLTARGFTVPELRPKPFVISATRIRYFFEEDRDAAPVVHGVVTALLPGASAAGDARIQDFTHYTPKPLPRTLELWLNTGPG